MYLSSNIKCTGKGTGRGKGKGKAHQVAAAPGPGEGMTSDDLWSRWQGMGKSWVLEFYGRHRSEYWACFSNFYEAPFVFVVPPQFCALPLTNEERTVCCDFSEKAIMVCKAAIMGDRQSYVKIAASKHSQAKVKSMGREVKGFKDDVWKNVVCSVAYEVVYQKFLKSDGLQARLLETEDWLICEATKNDANWGIGNDKGDPRNQNPSKWRGTNVLGWALMEARSTLRREAEEKYRVPVPAPAAADVTHVNSPQSELSKDEKTCLKTAKKAREILRLEQRARSGEVLDATQLNKLEGAAETFSALLSLVVDLPADSEVRQRNDELLTSVEVVLKGGNGRL
jgi:ribA/ribD-fused uncharacterized protein